MNLKITIFPLLPLALLLNLATCCKEDPIPRKGKSSAVFNPDKEYGTVQDIDGNEYKTITIGTQTWMAENLRVTHYRNGDPIPNVTGAKDSSLWGQQTQGAWCSYENTRDVDEIVTYGLLYNWYTCVDERGLCPDGWHVPTDEEWTILVTYLDNGDNAFDPNGTGANGIVGGRLKETGTHHWAFPNRFADNSSGFTALPGGFRDVHKGVFQYKTFVCQYHSITLFAAMYPLGRTISTDFAGITRSGSPMTVGRSVRCIQNE